MTATLAALLIQLVMAGITQVAPLITALKGLIQSHPTMTPEQKAALLTLIDQDVKATTTATDAALNAVDTSKPPAA